MSDLLGVATALAGLLTLGVVALGRFRNAVVETAVVAVGVAGIAWLVGLALTLITWNWVVGLLVYTPPLFALALGFALLVAVLRGRFEGGPAR